MSTVVHRSSTSSVVARRVPAKLAFGGVLAVGALVASAVAAHALSRVAGANRYETAVLMNQDVADDEANIVVASGQSYQGALAGAFLAGQGDGGYLFLTPDEPDALPVALADQLETLGDESDRDDRFFVIDPLDTIAGSTVVKLEAAYNRDRVDTQGVIDATVIGGGAAETAAQVAQLPGTVVGDHPQYGRTAIVASDAKFPDALAASVVAYAEHFPLLFSERDQLPAVTRSALGALDIDTVLLMGGTAALGNGVLGALETDGYDVIRIAGANRLETATELAEFVKDRLGFQFNNFALARGDNYPDALSGAVFAGDKRIPILLAANPDELGAKTEQWLYDNCVDYLGGYFVFGGEAAVSSTATRQADVAVNDC